MTTAAFEWEFDQTHPSGVKKSESRISAEQRASQELDGLIKKSTGKTKEILRFLRKSIGFDNLESKFLQASSECDSVIGLFGKHLYGINGEEFSYSAIGKRLANQRNNFAHGKIDKEPDSMAILDLLFLRYFILAIQLKRIDVSDASIRKAINELFRLHIALPDTTKEDGL